ncbi:hypothetical protein D3C86_1772880 [compost metagenome]
MKIQTGISNAFFRNSIPLKPGMSISRNRISRSVVSIKGSASSADSKTPKISRTGNFLANDTTVSLSISSSSMIIQVYFLVICLVFVSSVYLKCRLSISGFWPDFNPANLSRNTSSAENK